MRGRRRTKSPAARSCFFVRSRRSSSIASQHSSPPPFQFSQWLFTKIVPAQPAGTFEHQDALRRTCASLHGLFDIAWKQPIIGLLKKYAHMKQATIAQPSPAWMLHKFREALHSLKGVLNQPRVYGYKEFT